MSATQRNSTLDTLLLILAAALVLGGIAGYMALEDQAIAVVRVAGLLVAIGLALLVASRTAKGHGLLQFLRNADIERRKVVWPTRQETVQTTIMVLIVTLIVAVILFLFDTFLGWLVRQLMSGD